VRFAARAELEALFDDLALNLGWRAQRLDSRMLILDSDGLFVTATGGRKAEYCSCYFGLWADSAARAEAARAALLARVAETRIREAMFSIDWHFLTAKGELESADIEELADDTLYDEAYPKLQDGVAAFVRGYLDAAETVLVLQGPPGTGKTRLIRAILGELSRRKSGEAQALYTGDIKALEKDEIFVKFITGWHDVFVVEDADHVLKPRASGNENLHRFLTIADGVVRSQGRKIIFSTNLPNIGDLDDALVRPGRCYARTYLRELEPGEGERLVARLCAGDAAKAARAGKALAESGASRFSLAQIYQAVRRA
jgi:SpoVK/Ycf46/Vps4 family AAA+-type ATPase